MNEKEYLQKLSLSLNHLPQPEKEDALEYVQEYLEEAKSQGNASYMDSLPAPEEFARRLSLDLEKDSAIDSIRKNHCGSIEEEMPEIPGAEPLFDIEPTGSLAPSSFAASLKKALLIFLAVLFSPVALGLLCCIAMTGFLLVMAAVLLFLFVILFGLMGVVAILSCFASIPLLLFKAFLLMPDDFLGTVFNTGLALILLGTGIMIYQVIKLYFLEFIPFSWQMLKKISLFIVCLPKKLFQFFHVSASEKRVWKTNAVQG